jgi:SAM-dependent methyltransferase
MSRPSYLALADHYEGCLERHGDTHLGVDWPDADDAQLRHRVMLEVVRPGPGSDRVRVLDLGCGAGHLLEHIRERGLSWIDYTGADVSQRFVDLCREKFPETPSACVDLLAEDPAALGRFDYVVMNGVFTIRASLAQDEMFAFMTALVGRAFSLADRGVAFNVMSKHVDWERDDLFHVPYDELAAWLVRDLTRHHVIRADYGLYEYTAYAYR